jgi:hypothetical protein
MSRTTDWVIDIMENGQYFLINAEPPMEDEPVNEEEYESEEMDVLPS